MTYYFYDTCSLLLKTTSLFDDENQVVISSVTLNELENIKTSNVKDAETKYAARKILNMLSENPDKYIVEIFTEDLLIPFTDKHLSITPDIQILSTAFKFAQSYPDTYFITNDMALQCIASIFFDKKYILHIDENYQDEYTGYIEVTMSDEELNYFYQHQEENRFDLLINQYLGIKNAAGDIIDRLVWTGETYRHLNYDYFDSRWFGKIRPYKDDLYQMFVADSLTNNQITMVKGPAGSGKTFLSLGFLMHKLEKHEIDRIIVFCNTVATKNSAKMGFYPGTRDEKLLDSQIGNLLISKLGDRTYVEDMIAQGILVLLPLSDIRGYDTSGMNAGIYISEAQNMDIELMKLALQRIGEDSICIIDGDDLAQVDDIHFAGANNGMRRVSKIFRNHDLYGEVKLQTIHRSRIAEIAQEL